MLFSRLKTRIASLFSLVVGASRGKGEFAYQDSTVLYNDEGNYDRMGMQYWGGNKETFYVQILGIGCAHVFSVTMKDESLHEWELVDFFKTKEEICFI